MQIRQTHTYAELEVSAQAYDEIAKLLRDAGYDHVFMDGGAIDMHGIGLTRSSAAAQSSRWQLIETAPKDGTRIDLWAIDRRFTNCRWGRFDAESKVPFGPEHWRGLPTDPIKHSLGHLFEPTHWMPIPSGPSLPSTQENPPLVRRSEADAYFKMLQTIARFPITDPNNVDAINMRLIAEGALAVSSTERK